ncbi:MAG: TonB-dependent receptor, partial [Rhodocyclaceae bacterium]
VKDLINTVCDASYNCSPENVSKAKLRGLTLAYGDQIAGFNVDASVDFLDARDADTDLRLPRRASRQAALKVSRPIGAWVVGGEWQGVGYRYDSSDETRRMGGYGLVHAFARYAVNKDWSVEGRINNLGDKKYETAWGYGSVGTDVFVGVRYAPAK